MVGACSVSAEEMTKQRHNPVPAKLLLVGLHMNQALASFNQSFVSSDACDGDEREMRPIAENALAVRLAALRGAVRLERRPCDHLPQVRPGRLPRRPRSAGQ